MRLLGVKTVTELNERHVNTALLDAHLFNGESGLDKVGRELRSRL